MNVPSEARESSVAKDGGRYPGRKRPKAGEPKKSEPPGTPFGFQFRRYHLDHEPSTSPSAVGAAWM